MLQAADLLILNGAGYESRLAFTSLQGDNILDTTATVETMLLPIEEARYIYFEVMKNNLTQLTANVEQTIG